jgi:hypothetical protein
MNRYVAERKIEGSSRVLVEAKSNGMAERRTGTKNENMTHVFDRMTTEASPGLVSIGESTSKGE